VDDGSQTEVVLKELEKAMEKKRERKGKERAKDSEDTVMNDGSDISECDRKMYEDLSGYEDEDEDLVAAPPATKHRLPHVRPQYRLARDPDQQKHRLGAHPLTTMDR